MKKHVLLTLAATLVLGSIGSRAGAQCTFQHPAKALSLKSSLVQAFTSCANFANTTTESGIPSCKPPETFNEDAGSPPDGWRWGDLVTAKGQGEVKTPTFGNMDADDAQAWVADLTADGRYLRDVY